MVTDEDTPVGFDVLGNDEDIDSEFSIDSFTQPANGLVVEGGERLRLHPERELQRGRHIRVHHHRRELTDTATVTVTVGSVNDRPVSVDEPGIERMRTRR